MHRVIILSPQFPLDSGVVAQMAQIVQGLGRVEGQQSGESGGANGANWLKSHMHTFEFADGFFP